jgi:hypothetical protein
MVIPMEEERENLPPVTGKTRNARMNKPRVEWNRGHCDVVALVFGVVGNLPEIDESVGPPRQRTTRALWRLQAKGL